MPEMWKQEGLRCAGSYLRGDFKEELSTSRSGRWQQGTPMTQAEFHARAWKLANDKARELGWIV